MDRDAPSALFLGDLDDPWVVAIADALPEGAVRIHAPSGWPGDWPLGAEGARVVIVHRAIVGPADCEAFRAIKARPLAPAKLLLCVGPNVRASDLDRWAGAADLVLPEATASETIARHVAAWRRPAGRRAAVTVLGGSFEMRRMLASSCEASGERVTIARDWDEVPPGGPVLWDVPVLEPDWEATLQARARDHLVVALIGFADRDLVDRARREGAAACLDVPFEPADLAFVLDRLAAERPMLLPFDAAHETPPRPMGRPRVARPVADPRADS